MGAQKNSETFNKHLRRKLKRWQWGALYIQFTNTPAPDDGSSETSEHWKLIVLLNQFGYNPFSRQAAVKLAQELLDDGYQEEYY